jgi:hypothetical protein
MGEQRVAGGVATAAGPLPRVALPVRAPACVQLAEASSMNQVFAVAERDSFDGATPAIDSESAGAARNERDVITDIPINEDVFGIRVADTDEGRSSASMLINKMYAWRGYAGTHRIEDNPNRITLTASLKSGAVLGTVTLSMDSPIGILADGTFKDQIDTFRAKGAKVCEITKLAFDPAVRSKVALASLFHILYIYARHLHGCTDAFIEVNPRHRRFYEYMLNFKRLGEVRENPRVNAPAYLLWIDIGEMTELIKQHGGTSDNPALERSLYPYFFSQREEKGISDRLLNIDKS